MYPLKAFRVPCDSLRVAQAADTLPLVAVPDMLRESFVGLDHVPLYYFDYVADVDASWKPHDRVAVVSSEQLVVCDMNGDVRRCVELEDIVDVVVDQSGPPRSKLSHLRAFLGKRQKYTRVYMRLTHGRGLLLRVVRDVTQLLRAVASLGGANVRVVESASQFESCVSGAALRAMGMHDEAVFRTPVRSYLTSPEMVEKTLVTSAYGRSRRASGEASQSTPLEVLQQRRRVSWGTASLSLSGYGGHAAQAPMFLCAGCRQPSQDSLVAAGRQGLRSLLPAGSTSSSTAAAAPPSDDSLRQLRPRPPPTAADNIVITVSPADDPTPNAVLAQYNFPEASSSGDESGLMGPCSSDSCSTISAGDDCDAVDAARNTPAELRRQGAVAAAIFDSACGMGVEGAKPVHYLV